MAKARGKAPSRSQEAPKTPGLSSGRPKLVKQPHGGALQVGNPGNKGGPGRPSTTLIELATGMARDDVLPVMQQIVNDETRDDQARIAAGGKILSVVPKQEVVLTFTGQEDLVRFAAAIKRVLEDELPAKTLEALYPKIGAAFHEAHRTLTEGR